MINQPHALLIMRLNVQNANAVSSPLTWGFPPPSAFTGFVHALSLRLQKEREKDPELADIEGLTLDGVGIVSHRFEPQTSTPAGKRTQVFALTRNPLTKEGTTAAIVEEGRAHLEVSLIIGVYGGGDFDFSLQANAEWFANRVYQAACAMRLAGGSIFAVPSYANRPAAILTCWPEYSKDMEDVTRKLRPRLLPSFALMSRDDLLQSHLASLQQTQTDATALDALLDLSRLNIDCTQDEHNPDKGHWQIRKKQGWLVPLPVGYATISELYPAGTVKNARDPKTPFCFVESVLSLGEWRSPHRINNLSHLLWFHSAEPESGLYRCTQPFAPTVK
jgi:CRISPR-associated protein Csy2